MAALSNSLGKLASMVDGSSKKSSRTKKKLALAQTAISIPSAVMQAIGQGGGLLWGAIPGAITLAAGIKQLQASGHQEAKVWW